MRSGSRLQLAGALTPRDRIWAAIRRFGLHASFSPAEIAFLSEQRVDTTCSYVDALVKSEHLVRLTGSRPNDRPRREIAPYVLVRDGGVDAPRLDATGKAVTHGRGREHMWLVARKSREPFDWRWLAMIASTEEHVIAPTEAQTYLRLLARAGYVRNVKKGGGRGRAALFEFVRARDTGPRPPMVSRDKSVIDANTNKVMLDGGKRAA